MPSKKGPGRCWLMKSEPDSFAIQDLQKVSQEPWSGVRNYQARNFMRDEMQVGDRVLFYHSNAKPSGVAGLATVASKAYPDPTQFDVHSEYFDPQATTSGPRWFLVDVRFVRAFTQVLALEEMRKASTLSGMLLFQASRLSVQPVSAEHYDAIVALAR
jgi:predicted RNA-binding protein with PUA-like domain